MVEELAETIKKDIINNSKKFVNTGCIDFDYYTEGNFTLPRMFVTAFLNNHKDEYKPLYLSEFDDYENMKHFI